MLDRISGTLRSVWRSLNNPEGSDGEGNGTSRSPIDLKRRYRGHRGLRFGRRGCRSDDHLLIEKVSGRVAYAVMSFGGFLGLAHSHYPIPWSALKYDTALGGYRAGIREEQLRDAPAFSDDSWTDRDWETRTHQHYGSPPYWG